MFFIRRVVFDSQLSIPPVGCSEAQLFRASGPSITRQLGVVLLPKVGTEGRRNWSVSPYLGQRVEANMENARL